MKKRELNEHTLCWNIFIDDGQQPVLADIKTWSRWFENLEIDLDPKVELKSGSYPVKLQRPDRNLMVEYGAVITNGQFDIVPMLDRLDMAQAQINEGKEDYIFLDTIQWDKDLNLFVATLNE